MPTANEQLNRCPRCKSKAVMNEQMMLPGSGNTAEFNVSCLDCGHKTEWCSTQEEAASRWNRQRPLVR
jgi:DNA-directed RNA polymerase subunit RPC12/RpoP